MAYGTYYQVITKEGKKLIDCHNHPAACFAVYNSGGFHYEKGRIANRLRYYTGDNILKLFVKKPGQAKKKLGIYNIPPRIKKNPILKEGEQPKKPRKPWHGFTRRQIKLHLARLAQCGFKSTLEENDVEYTITLNEADYMNHTHIRTALDFFRLLWEDGITRILRRYYRIPLKLRKKFDYLEILQLLQFNLGGKTGGHGLPRAGYFYPNVGQKGSVLTSNEILSELEQKKDHSGGSFALWKEVAEKRKTAQLSKEELNKIHKWNPAKPGRLERMQRLLAPPDTTIQKIKKSLKI